MKKKRVLAISIAALVGVVAVFSILLATHVICPVHKWQKATCTEPMTCEKCGRTQGEALGHDWLDATCEEPATCSRCGATEGEALGHDWQEATCTEPKICKVCGATEGEALGHDWQDATCTAPMTCSRCKETQGEALGHTPGEWQKADDNIVTGTYWMKQYCTVCQEVLDEDVYTYTTYLENGEFIITPKEFSDRLELCLDQISGNLLHTDMIAADGGEAGCLIRNSIQNIMVLSFSSGGTDILLDSADTAHMDNMLGYCSGNDDEIVARLLVAIPLACDPALEFEDAKSIASQLLDQKVYTKNGVQYVFDRYKGGFAIMITVQ